MANYAIVPAHNEETRIARVLEVLVRCDFFDVILVVNDGSTDRTSEVAREFMIAYGNVEVLDLQPNRGKGRAMYEAIGYLDSAQGSPPLGDSDVIVFVDADLIGLREDHLKSLVFPVASGEWDLVVGMRDYGPGWTEVTRNLPLISGERACAVRFLRAMPESAWRGYGVEVGMNDAVSRAGGRIGTVVLDGLSIVLKWEKNPGKGVADMLKMATEVTRAMVTARRGAAGAAAVVEAPAPASVTAECDSTECVTDALAKSLVAAGGPFARDELWTPDVQERVGRIVGRQVARPLWISAGVGSFFLLGPIGPCLTGLAWLVSSAEPEA